jgi:hypothetical protein
VVIHAEQLCQHEDHLWDVLEQVSIPLEQIEDRRQPWKVTYDTEAVVRAYLFGEVYGYSQNRLAEELSRHPSLQAAFGLDPPPTQQSLAYIWKRLSPRTRRLVVAAGKGIARAAVREGIISEALTPATPATSTEATAEETTRETVRRKSKKSLRLARRHILPEFDTKRAANRQYSDEELFEVAVRMAASDGSAHSEGEVGWLLDDEATCHGATFLRALKKLATPEGDLQQTDLQEFSADTLSAIRRICEEVQAMFDGATDNILSSIRGEELFDDRRTVAAIDITHDRFWPSPWVDREAGVPKTEYPSMVSGYRPNDDSGGSRARGYAYATITLVGDHAPIILGLEPVKEASAWEPDGALSHSKGDVVDRLLKRATEIVDIDEVLMDRAFYSVAATEAVEDHGLLYTVPVPRYETDLENIADVREHPEADAAVLHDQRVGGRYGADHTTEYLYVPSDRDGAEGRYAIFATNRDRVAPSEIEAVTNRYRRRWDIENQYKTVQAFAPRTSSTDYRVRFAEMALAAALYNLWRLVDYFVKAALGRPVRSPPVVTARVFARVAGQFLRRVT